MRSKDRLSRKCEDCSRWYSWKPVPGCWAPSSKSSRPSSWPGRLNSNVFIFSSDEPTAADFHTIQLTGIIFLVEILNNVSIFILFSGVHFIDVGFNLENKFCCMNTYWLEMMWLEATRSLTWFYQKAPVNIIKWVNYDQF